MSLWTQASPLTLVSFLTLQGRLIRDHQTSTLSAFGRKRQQARCSVYSALVVIKGRSTQLQCEGTLGNSFVVPQALRIAKDIFPRGFMAGMCPQQMDRRLEAQEAMRVLFLTNFPNRDSLFEKAISIHVMPINFALLPLSAIAASPILFHSGLDLLLLAIPCSSASHLGNNPEHIKNGRKV